MSKQIKVALIGNPNTGKTSVFNALTGLNQKVGNYPGITVDKKEGVCKLSRGVKAHILDLPGTYSLNASSLDENVVIELLLNKKDKDYPDVALIISDVENLKRNLLLFTQIKDLKIPAILVINMADRMPKKGISLNLEILEHELKTKVALVSTRKNDGIQFLKKLIENFKTLSTEPCLDTSTIDEEYFANLKKAFPNQDLYKLWVVISQDANFGKIDRNSVNVSRFKTKTKSELTNKKLVVEESNPILFLLIAFVFYESVELNHVFFILLISAIISFSVCYKSFLNNTALKFDFRLKLSGMIGVLKETKYFMLMYFFLVGYKRIEVLLIDIKFGDTDTGLFSSADNFYSSAYLFFTSLILVGIKDYLKHKKQEKIKQFFYVVALVSLSVLAINFGSEILYPLCGVSVDLK